MTLAVAVLVSTTICAPHLLRLERCSPTVAATIWLAALALRAISALFCAVFVVFYLPTTGLFSLITHWCWHAVIPFIAAHVPLNGHALTDAALIAPAFVLAISTLSVAVGLWRAARRVLVVPAATARMLTNSFARMLQIATAIGSVCGFVGMNLSYHLDVQSGPAIVLTAATLFGAVFLTTGVTGRRRAAGSTAPAPLAARID